MTDVDLFGQPSLVGRRIEMPTACPRCGGFAATLGIGAGPHAAALLCCCGKHLGWLSKAAAKSILGTTNEEAAAR